MMATLAALAEALQTELQLGVTGGVFTVNSTDARRSLRYLNIAGRDIAEAYPWQALWRSHSFTAVAGASQSLGFPSDYSRMVPETFYAGGDFMVGPVTPQEWAQTRATTASLLEKRFIRQNGVMQVYPAFAGGEACSYEYISNEWCESSGGVGQTEFLADTDTSRLDDDLLISAAAAQWLMSEGLPAAHMLSRFEDRFNALTGHDRPAVPIMAVDNALLHRGGFSPAGRHDDGVPPTKHWGQY